jgi:hypothetical protein
VSLDCLPDPISLFKGELPRYQQKVEDTNICLLPIFKMPSISHVALILGLILGAAAAPNSIVTPKGAETLTVGILGGK